MTALHFTGVLYYYDGVQVFEARDAIGGHYVGTQVEPESAGTLRYVIVGVTPENLQRFRLGQVDLRELMDKRPVAVWYIADLSGEIGKDVPVVERTEPIPEEYLPEAGFVLLTSWQPAAASTAYQESRARNNVVLEVALEVPESADAHKIRVNRLSGLLVNLQSFLKHAYGKAIGALSIEQRQALNRDTAPLLDVAVPALTGSFRLVLEAVQTPDLFGTGEIVRALKILDRLTAVAGNPEETLTRAQEYQGHTASSYVRLLRFLVESNVSFAYAWASPDREEVTRHAVTRAQAEPLLTLLSSSESVGTETVVLVGRLRKVDVDAGTWRLLSNADGREYSGKARPGVSLAHLITDDYYRFRCDEVVDEITGTGKEMRTLYLISYTPLGEVWGG